MLIIVSSVLTYLLGSLSSAIIVCKLWGLPDPRTQGSNNPGATNVLRIGSKLPAILTLLGDACKGLLPCAIAQYFHCSTTVLAVLMLAAVLGHVFPVFFGFKGGKGVATSMGAYLGLNLQLGGLLIGGWLMLLVVSRTSSLAALITAVCAPILCNYLMHDLHLTLASVFISLILLYRHRANIRRLWQGQEARI